nr:MAG TPA: hypothetical protein [Caudoviricetes sp.]
MRCFSHSNATKCACISRSFIVFTSFLPISIAGRRSAEER